MTQHCAFVDPSSLSLPSSSLKRPPSPACSTDDSSPRPSDQPPRKRPRSAVTPEERKEARAHRNRLAAQNSRDRRKAQFTHLERRVAELEEENRRLRAGIHVSPSPSISTVSEPDVSTIEREQEQLRKREEEQRERENQELRERIRTLEKGYEAVVRALTAQGNPSVTSSIPTPPATSPVPIVASHSQSSPQPASNLESSNTPSPLPNVVSLSSAPSLPLSPTSSNSTLVDSPLLFASGDSFEFPQSPPLNDSSLALPSESLDLSLVTNAPTRHLARVANTVGRSAVSLQRVGGAQVVMGPASTPRCRAVMKPRFVPYASAFFLVSLTLCL